MCLCLLCCQAETVLHAALCFAFLVMLLCLCWLLCCQAEEVLHAALETTQQRSERWAAVQCLVHAGAVSAEIISELLCYLLDFHEPRTQARAAHLLSIESAKTVSEGERVIVLSGDSSCFYRQDLVHSMIADQLNNSGWQERLAACNVLPKLHNSINKDMCAKLLTLTWEDWSPQVQLAAAKALGQTSHAKVSCDTMSSTHHF